MQDPGFNLKHTHTGKTYFPENWKKIKDIYIFSIVYNLINSINVGDEYN